MSTYERTITHLIKVYPRSYRDERGDEILATLLEASSEATTRTRILDMLDLVAHGIQIRLGLTSERFAGRVLGAAAVPGFVMAAAMSVFLFMYAVWIPYASDSLPSNVVPRPGIFHTIGPVVYAAWVLGAIGALAWPRRRTMFATICVTGTLVAIPIGVTFFASADFTMMAVLVSFGTPCVLAPTTDVVRRKLLAGVGAGVVLFVVVWWFSVGIKRNPGGTPYHWYGVALLGHGLPWIAGASFAGTCLLLVWRKSALAGAIVVLTAPFLIVAAAYRQDENGTTKGNILFGVMFVWLVGAWVVDLMRPKSGQMEAA